MNARAQQNSAQAIQWALKKKEMLQRAKGLQEQHRYGIMPPTSKKSMGAQPATKQSTQSQKTTKEKYEDIKNEELDQEEELRRARASLKLLKRKMSGKKNKILPQESEQFNRAQTCEVGEQRGAGKENTEGKGGSSLYRKIFKPKFDKPSKTSYGFALGMRQEDKNIRRNEPYSEMNIEDQDQDMSRFSSYAEKPIKTEKKKDLQFEENAEEIEMKGCEECGRKFNIQAYVKHRKICKKVFQTRRKKFDITSRRTAEGALAELKGRKTKGKKEEGKLRSNKWKQQSDQLRAAMRSIRGNNLGSSTDTFGTGAYAPLNDLTECDYCGRSFNDAAIERHRPICERNYKMKQIQNRKQAKKKLSRF